MPAQISAFGRVFAPKWPMTLITIVLLTAFIGLGRWQWQRGEAKEVLWQAFEDGGQAMPLGSRTLDEIPRYARVVVSGSYDPQHQLLLDNRSHAGKPGYEVLTPLRLADGRHVLVNRGWVPFTGYRDRLPDLPVPAGERSVSGRTDELPSAGLASGRAPPEPGSSWPKVTSFPTHEQLETALGQKIPRRILLLDADAADGFVRAWSPPGMAPERHYSYAIQWWGFALALLVLYFGLNFRKVP